MNARIQPRPLPFLAAATLLGALAARGTPSPLPPLACPAGTRLHVFDLTQWCQRGGVDEGPFERWWDPWQRAEAGTHVQGRRSGRWLSWYPSGVLAGRSDLEVGEPHGERARWWPNGVLASRERHLRGERVACEAFTEEGRLWWRLDRRQRLEAHWDPASGTLRSLRRGRSFRAWDGGRLVETGEYVGATKVGTWSRWSRRGVLVGKGPFVEGQREGVWETWHEDGSLASRGAFRCDVETGTWRFFHPGGRPAALGAYYNGRKHGRWLAWHENGRLRRVASHGDDVGAWTEWGPGGRLAGRGVADEGWEERLGPRGVRELTLGDVDPPL